MAVTQLEVAYDAFARLPTGWRGFISRMRYTGAHRAAATVALFSAGGYAAIGIETGSVERCLE
jgi:hypothetical protein